MRRKLRPARFHLDAEIEKIFMGKVKPIGNSAHVIVPKDFVGKEVFVLVPAKIKANSTKRVKVY